MGHLADGGHRNCLPAGGFIYSTRVHMLLKVKFPFVWRKQVFHERYKCLETFFYLVMGLGPALVVVFTGHHFHGMMQLKFGGGFYILGIVFFKADGTIPMAHAIWHLFVVLAAGCHYYAILVNLYPSEGAAAP